MKRQTTRSWDIWVARTLRRLPLQTFLEPDLLAVLAPQRHPHRAPKALCLRPRSSRTNPSESRCRRPGRIRCLPSRECFSPRWQSTSPGIGQRSQVSAQGTLPRWAPVSSRVAPPFRAAAALLEGRFSLRLSRNPHRRQLPATPRHSCPRTMLAAARVLFPNRFEA